MQADVQFLAQDSSGEKNAVQKSQETTLTIQNHGPRPSIALWYSWDICAYGLLTLDMKHFSRALQTEQLQTIKTTLAAMTTAAILLVKRNLYEDSGGVTLGRTVYSFILSISSGLNYKTNCGAPSIYYSYVTLISNMGRIWDSIYAGHIFLKRELLANSYWLWMANIFGFISNSNTMESKSLAWTQRTFGLCSALEILLNTREEE